MKDPKKVEVDKRLAAINRKKREEAQNGGMNQYYGIGAIIAVGVIGGLGYYIYQSKKGPAIREVTMPVSQQPWGCAVTPGLQGPCPQTNKFDMD